MDEQGGIYDFSDDGRNRLDDDAPSYFTSIVSISSMTS